MTAARIVAARRTAVMPRGGPFNGIAAHTLGQVVIEAVLSDFGLAPDRVDAVIMGNALYGGGNPARLAALAAGLPQSVPAMTIDTQCCSGLDAIALAAARIAAGEAEIVVAGGLESYSRAPIRMHRPLDADQAPEAYERPPFTPWPDRDPDMLAAAARLAARCGITRARQDAYAVQSHQRAGADTQLAEEIAPLNGMAADGFTRPLTAKTCARLPILAGDAAFGITAATTAIEADGAAAVLVVSERVSATFGARIVAATSAGGDPVWPGLAPIAAAKDALYRGGIEASKVDEIEIMEAFAAQAIACAEGLSLAPELINRRGGALARGHPIGASGAILAVRLFHDLRRGVTGRHGLAAIAAAGGLGSAMLLRAGR